MSDFNVTVNRYGDGRALVLRWTDPVTGKRRAKSSGTTDERQAERLAGELEKELRAGGIVSPGKITWQTFRERFEPERLADVPPSTKRAYTVALDHLENIIGPNRLAAVTSEVLSRFQRELRATGVRPATVAKNLRHLKAALRWAVRMGMMAKAPLIDMPKLPKGQEAMKGRPLVAEELDRMVLATKKVRPDDATAWENLLNGLWLSGLRLGEALALTWEPSELLSVDLTGKHPAFRIKAEGQKSRRAEVLPMVPDFAQWLLATFPEGERRGRVFKLTHKRTGTHVNGEQASNIISAIGEKAGVVTDKAQGKFATAHDLRRSFCTRWASKVKPAMLQRLARHADIATTMKYYVALDTEDAAAELWREFGNIGPVGNKTGNIGQNQQAEETAATARNSSPVNELE